MLQYTKYLLGATLLYFSTSTVVYGNTQKELCQNDTNVGSNICAEVRVEESSQVLRSESKTKNFIINIAQDNTLPQPSLTEQIGTAPQLVFEYLRNTGDGLFHKQMMLSSVPTEPLYWIQKHSEKLLTPIKQIVVLNILPLRATKVAMISDNSTTTAQSELIQQINIEELIIRRNLYIDIRTKLTYLQTFLDTLKAMKQLGNKPKYSTIRNRVQSNLDNNIQVLSNDEKLLQQFVANIPNLNEEKIRENWIAEHEERYVKFSTAQLKQARQIEGLKNAVSQTMKKEENFNWSVNLIASLVDKELKLTNRNNSSVRARNQRRNRLRTAERQTLK